MSAMRDPLNRPLPEHLLPQQVSASELILATSLSRFFSFIIDVIIITLLTAILSNFINKYIISLNVDNIILLFYIIWGIYIIAFALSRFDSTIGQNIVNVKLYSLFSHKISFVSAIARFILMSFSTIAIIHISIDLFFLNNEYTNLNGNIIKTKNSINYSLLLMVICLQLFILWPFLSGNLRNVYWDKILRCCVIKQKI